MNIDYILNGKKSKKKSKKLLKSNKKNKLGIGLDSLMLNKNKKPINTKKLLMIKNQNILPKMSKYNIPGNFSNNLNKLMVRPGSKNNIINDSMTFKQKRFLKKHKGIDRFADYDGDGVINGLDCHWNDPYKHNNVQESVSEEIEIKELPREKRPLRIPVRIVGTAIGKLKREPEKIKTEVYEREDKDIYKEAQEQKQKNIFSKIKDTTQKYTDYAKEAIKEKLAKQGITGYRDTETGEVSPFSVKGAFARSTGYIFKSPEERKLYQEQEQRNLLFEAKSKLDINTYNQIIASMEKEKKSIIAEGQRLGLKGEELKKFYEEKNKTVNSRINKLILDAYEEQKRKKPEQKQLEEVKQVQMQREKVQAQRDITGARYDIARVKRDVQELNRPSAPLNRTRFIGQQVQNIGLMDYMVGARPPAYNEIKSRLRENRFETGTQTYADEAEQSQRKINSYVTEPTKQGDYRDALRIQRRQPKFTPTFPSRGRWDQNQPRFMYVKSAGQLTRKTKKVNKGEQLKEFEESEAPSNKLGTSMYPSTKPLLGYKRVYIGSGDYVKRGRPAKQPSYIKHRTTKPTKFKKSKFTKYVRTYGEKAFD